MPTDLPRKKVLIVDDAKTNISILVEALRHDFKLGIATSGLKALDYIQENTPDLVLLDIMMPGMDGYEVCSHLKEDPKTSDIPVVFITAMDESEDKARGFQLGAVDFITKPFDVQEVLARVKVHVTLREQELQIRSYASRLEQLAQERVLTLIDQMREGVIITDSHFCPVHVNRKARRLLGIQKEPPKDVKTWLRDTFNVSLASIIAGASPVLLERKETDKFNPLILSLTGETVRTATEEIDSHIIVVRDVTQDHLENRLRYDFLSLISHKFKTPLTGIKIVADHLDMEVQDEMLRGYVDHLCEKERELEQLLSRLFHLIGIENMNLRKEVDAAQIDLAIGQISGKYPDQKYKVNRDLGSGRLIAYQKMIIEELVDNAFKFNDKPELHIDIALSEGKMTFSDNGPGIPPEELENIFEPFYQIDKDFTGTVPGAGLGLTLVSKLVSLHAGNLEVESHLEQGSSFRITYHEEDSDLPDIQ